MEKMNAPDIQPGQQIRYYGERLTVESVSILPAERGGTLYEFVCKGDRYTCTVALFPEESVRID